MTANLQDDRAPFLEPFELDQHLRIYGAELAEAGYTPLTIKGHADSVCHFGTWCHHQGVALKQIDALTLDRFDRHRCRCPGRAIARNFSITRGERPSRPADIVRELCCSQPP